MTRHEICRLFFLTGIVIISLACTGLNTGAPESLDNEQPSRTSADFEKEAAAVVLAIDAARRDIAGDNDVRVGVMSGTGIDRIVRGTSAESMGFAVAEPGVQEAVSLELRSGRYAWARPDDVPSETRIGITYSGAVESGDQLEVLLQCGALLAWRSYIARVHLSSMSVELETVRES